MVNPPHTGLPTGVDHNLRQASRKDIAVPQALAGSHGLVEPVAPTHSMSTAVKTVQRIQDRRRVIFAAFAVHPRVPAVCKIPHEAGV